MAKIKLKGHEKFPPREGWITKGLKEIDKDARIFSSADASYYLGVGTNMVKSIRYWMLAFGLVTYEKTGAVYTAEGDLIKNNDTYLEQDFTIWLLHSMLVKNKEVATSWNLFFENCKAEEFSKEEITELMIRELKTYAGTEEFKESALKDDIDVILNMYSKTKEKDDPEDKNRSPLAALGLLKKEKDVYYKKSPDLRHFDIDIIRYELAQTLAEGEGASMSIDPFVERMKGIYQLNKTVLNEMLDKCALNGDIEISRTAGVDTMYRKQLGNATTVIEEHYRRTGDK